MKLKKVILPIQRQMRKARKSVFRFNLSRRIQMHLEALQKTEAETIFEVKKLQREYELLKTKNKGLKDLEERFGDNVNTLNGNLTEALSHEIKRLMSVIATQRQIIEKTPFLLRKTSQIRKPILFTNKNPLKFARNFITFQKELYTYKQAVMRTNKAEFQILLHKNEPGVVVSGDSSKAYQSEFIKENNSSIQIGDKLKRTYYLADIPAYLSPYIFFRLLTSDLPFTLSIFVEPAPSSELLKQSRQRLSVLEMQQNERLKAGKLRDQQVDKNIEEVMSFIDELVHEAEKGVVYALYLQLEATDETKLAILHKSLQNVAGSMDMTFNRYTFGQKTAFKNFLPFNTDHVNENKILQSTAASYLMPFVSKQLNDPNGIFMGVNAYNNSLVFIDPFTSRNNNINIFGVSGSGKSVTSKILMNRLYMRGIQIIVIDPEGEYVELARSLGGEVIQFSRENGINPFFIASSEENEILDHISTIKTFLKFFIPTHHYEGAILDECLIKLYDSGSPNFSNLLELLGDHQMRKDLSVLSTGSLRGVFNSERKLELANDMIVLDLHDLKKDEKREPAMYLLTSLIWNLVNKNNDKKRMLFIDEAHKLLSDTDVALFYRELVKQARKRNVGIVSITQDVEDFLKNEFGKTIITNSETKILLKQSYATLTDIGTIYPMTDEEKTNLGHLGVGEVVLFREEEHTRLNIVVLPHEKPLVFTR